MTLLNQIHWENLKVGDHLRCNVTSDSYQITALENHSGSLDDNRGNLIYYRHEDAPLNEVECRGHLESNHLRYVGSAA